MLAICEGSPGQKAIPAGQGTVDYAGSGHATIVPLICGSGKPLPIGAGMGGILQLALRAEIREARLLFKARE